MSYLLEIVTKPESSICPNCNRWIREGEPRLKITKVLAGGVIHYHTECGFERLIRAFNETTSTVASHQLQKAVAQFILCAADRPIPALNTKTEEV